MIKTLDDKTENIKGSVESLQSIEYTDGLTLDENTARAENENSEDAIKRFIAEERKS